MHSLKIKSNFAQLTSLSPTTYSTEEHNMFMLYVLILFDIRMPVKYVQHGL